MATETRTCQSCQASFVIAPEDFDFYTRVKTPSPTFCPDCRLQRRMAWRNERTFYKGKCAATGKDFLTMFSPETNMTVYERDYWWSDKWDQLESGRDYDFSKSFFTQFAELMKAAPLPNMANSNCVGSEWGNHSLDMKNAYLHYASAYSENVSYVTGAIEVKDSLDLYKPLKGTQCYENTLCGSSNRLFFSYDSDENMQSEFLFACNNLQQSLGCVNLHNSSYCIFNRHYTKDEYQKERAKYDFGSYKQLEEFKKNFNEFTLRFPRRFATSIKSNDVTGDMIMTSKNCRHCFDVYGELENCKYLYHAMTLKESYDGYGLGAGAELMYECVDTGAQARHCMFNVFTHGSQESFYTYACHSSSNLFGCVGLRSKQYCILNKQYSKEEYENIIPRILEQMKAVPYVDSRGRRYAYGEFFPIELSPFAYNETIAQEYAPLTKSVAESAGYHWRKPVEKHYAITLKAADLPDHIKDITDSVLKDVIECGHNGECNHQCATAFKIIPSELQFLKHFNIALPRLCPNCRHYERLAKRPPFKLWMRSCDCAGVKSARGGYQNNGAHPHGDGACSAQFETPFAPERKEIIYCESCYQQEIA